MPLHEWNSGREWKDDGRQHYELDLRTWVFLLIHIEFSTTGITGIQKERKIKAKDKGSVFTVMAKGRMTKGSSIDIHRKKTRH